MRKLSFLLVVFFLMTQTAFAETGIPDSRDWVPTSYGGGGSYPMVVPDKFTADKVYVVSDVNVPFVTTNKGEQWNFITDASHGFDIGQPTALFQSPNTATLMYAIGASGINKTIDGGTTWTRVNGGKATRTSSGKVIVIDPNDDNIVYAGLDNGNIMRTIDGGTNWTIYGVPFGLNSKPTFLFVNADSSKLFVGHATLGLVIYDLGTDTPTSVTLTGTNALRQTDYATYVDLSAVEHFCTTAGLKIACTPSTDGTTWTYTAATVSGGTASTFYVHRIDARQLAGGDVRFVVFRRLISNASSSSVEQYSHDSGATWGTATTTKSIAMNPTEAMTTGGWTGNSIAIDPHDEDIVYFTTNWNIFRSDDGGQTYFEKVVGAQNTVTSDVKISPNGTIFMCSMDTGCQYSTNHGTTWTQALPTSSSQGGHYWRVLLTGTEAEWNAGNGHVITMSNYWSDNKPRIHRSILNGVAGSWTTITTNLPQVALFGDAIWGTGYIRATAKSADEQTLYIGMDGENCDGDGPGGLPYSCTTNMMTGGVWRSSDNGATWARHTSSPRKVYNALAVDPTVSAGTTLIFGTFGYNIYKATQSSIPLSYGNWTYASATNYIYDAVYDSLGHPYAVGTSSGPVIYKSVTTVYGDANGGFGTWQLMKRLEPASNTSGIADGILVDPNNNDRVFVSITLGPVSGRHVWVTADAHNHTNATWTDITGDLAAFGGCQALAIDPNEGAQGYLYCASNGGGLHKLNLADSPTVYTGTLRIGQ